MRRRALLAAVAAGTSGLAGWGGLPLAGRDGPPPADRSTPADGPASADPPASTDRPVSTDEGPDTASPTFRYTTAGGELTVERGPVEAPDLAWAVEKVADATPEHPCRVRIAVENTGSPREVTAAGPLPFPVTPGDPADGDEGYRPALVPVDADARLRSNGRCWGAELDDPRIADDSPWDWGHGTERTTTLAADERLAADYHVLSSWTACYGRGEYAFDRRYALDGTTHEWGFALVVPSLARDV